MGSPLGVSLKCVSRVRHVHGLFCALKHLRMTGLYLAWTPAPLHTGWFGMELAGRRFVSRLFVR
jgi:hypothetical protein